MSSSLVSFAGIVSISSAVGSVSVEWLVKIGGVKALLITSLITTLLSFAFAEIAYAPIVRLFPEAVEEAQWGEGGVLVATR